MYPAICKAQSKVPWASKGIVTVASETEGADISRTPNNKLKDPIEVMYK